jgi:hypothetical protein
VNLTITPLIRIVALIGGIAILALGGGVMMLGRSHTPATPAAGERHGSATPRRKTTTVHTNTPASTAAHAKTKPKTATPTTHAKKTTPATVHKATPATAHKATTPHTTVTKHKVTTHKKASPAKFHGNPVFETLPAPLQWELAHHKVVVVSFYNPHADVDAISVAEAHAGATAAGAGFLLVNVLNNKVAGILTGLLPDGGLLPEPGVIMYQAPGTIVMRFDGFVDRDSIAQAAANAMLVAATTPTPTATTPAASAAGATP